MSFKTSRFYRSIVDTARSERGWLPKDEFMKLGKQEFHNYRRSRGFGGPRRGNAATVIVAVVAVLILLSMLN